MVDNFPFEVVSEDGKTYQVDVWAPTFAELKNTYDKFSCYPVLFSDTSARNFESFAAGIMSPLVVVFRIICEEQEIGLAYLTKIRPAHSAEMHHLFWDRRSRGRQRLMLVGMKRVMDELMLHKIDLSVPMYAFSALHRIHKLGIRIEGRRREGALKDGKWSDVLEFSVLRSELTDEAIEQGSLVRTDNEHLWHGLLKQDELLSRKILRVRSAHGS